MRPGVTIEVEPRSGDVLGLAEALKRENPARTAAHVCELLALSCGWAPNQRTIQRHFRGVGPSRPGVRAVRGEQTERAVDSG